MLIMKRFNIALFVLFVGLAFSCNRTEVEDTGDLRNSIFYATNADNSATKTILQNDGTILWNAGDLIDLFISNNAKTEFHSLNEIPASEVQFAGDLSNITWPGTVEYWAVYPSKESNSFDGSSITVILPDSQIATEGSFAKDLYISMAKSTDNNLSFYNVCGGVKFSVGRDDVKTVKFKGANNEILAGQAKVYFDNEGHPKVGSIIDGSTEITLSAPSGTTFKKDSWYYIVAFPVALTKGFIVSFEATGEPGVFTADNTYDANKSVEIKRSVWGRLPLADGHSDYELSLANNVIAYKTEDGSMVNLSSTEGVNNHFHDDVSGWNFVVFNNDVISVKTHFKGTPITSVILPARVDNIQSNAFKGCSKLTDFTLPDAVTQVSSGAFIDCPLLASFKGVLATSDGRCIINPDGSLVAFAPAGLTEYTVPSEAVRILNSFNNCDDLTSINIPEGVSFGEGAFSGCHSITKVTVGALGTGQTIYQGFPDCYAKITDISITGGTTIPDYACYECSSLSSIILPDSVRSIGDFAFTRCSNLRSLEMPNLLETIGEGAFYSTDLKQVEIPEHVISMGIEVLCDCRSLESVDFMGDIKSIGSRAFAGCTALTAVNLCGKVPCTIGDDIFADCSMVYVYVPEGCLPAYRTANGWDSYYSIIMVNAEYVDLGLSVKWGACNIGASSETGYGNYYAWGEIEPKVDYSWNSYKFGTESASTKYCTNKDHWWRSWYNEDPDYKVVLDKEDDVAFVERGGKWRMPTYAEVRELHLNTTKEWVTINGVVGERITSNINGRSIFLPAGGYKTLDYTSYPYKTVLENVGTIGGYWTSSMEMEYGDNTDNNAVLMGIDAWGDEAQFVYGPGEKSSGQLIRPVCDK